MGITISESKDFDLSQILPLYKANQWSSAEKPENLVKALLNSHSLVTAWDQDKLVGLGNAISDGYLVVYYPHLLVMPTHQRKGVGRMIMDKMAARYRGFHQQILVSDGKAIGFYERCGFVRAGETQSMWVFKEEDHT